MYVGATVFLDHVAIGFLSYFIASQLREVENIAIGQCEANYDVAIGDFSHCRNLTPISNLDQG